MVLIKSLNKNIKKKIFFLVVKADFSAAVSKLKGKWVDYNYALKNVKGATITRKISRRGCICYYITPKGGEDLDQSFSKFAA
jgi:hypothetical protein